MPGTASILLFLIILLIFPLRTYLLMQMLGMPIPFQGIPFIITGTRITTRLPRPMVNTTYYLMKKQVQLAFFLFICSLSMVSVVYEPRGAGFYYRRKMRVGCYFGCYWLCYDMRVVLVVDFIL